MLTFGYENKDLTECILFTLWFHGVEMYPGALQAKSNLYTVEGRNVIISQDFCRIDRDLSKRQVSMQLCKMSSLQCYIF